MKWFWYSLLGFCVLMCSCKTKKSAHLINEASKENVQTEWIKFQTLRDTSSVLRIDIDKSKLTITETITTRKYDKDTGIVTEETETKRKIAQDSDKVVAEEETQSVTDCNQLNVDHIEDKLEMVESETKEESIGGQEAFGKWLGIGIACVIGIFLLYLLKKLRVNKQLRLWMICFLNKCCSLCAREKKKSRTLYFILRLQKWNKELVRRLHGFHSTTTN